MTVGDNQVLGKAPSISNFRRNTVRQEIKPTIPEKFATINDYYNELVIDFMENYSVVFRVYNNGVAYRFQTRMNKELKIYSEQVTFNFTGTNYIYFPEEEGFFSHNERSYQYVQLDKLPSGKIASLPFLVETTGPKILISESALRDYPGLWIKSSTGNTLSGTFSHYPLESKTRPFMSGEIQVMDRNVPVTKSADYIAKTEGNRFFPWRIIAIAREDGDLITNQLVYQLGEESRKDDTTWIKPGKVAWDWWNANNIYGVNFKSGVNTETYKYYIDFASRFGIEYIILDEGWYVLGDLLNVVPEMDVDEIIKYGKEKNVGVILWVIWKTLDEQLEIALDQFEKWGAAGIKVDFMQRDDQEMVNYYWKIASETAKRKLLVDFHGAYKPSGLRRTYPNVITREGVKGLEHNKWSKDITPTHNLTLPFIRMVSGPMDYTPGAMINAQPDNFQIVFSRPMSMGTRTHQIAMYVIYESPLQMMADSPSNYMKESECTEFISQIPTTWEDTRVLAAKIAEYIVLARKNSDHWYIGAMTNEKARELIINLSFLNDGDYVAETFEDGINADRYAGDYRRVTQTVSRNDSVTIKLEPGGGWVTKLTPRQQ
jgi:alpha-glucosidase